MLDTARLKEFEDCLQTEFVGKPKDCSNEYWHSIDSTNSRLAELAAKGVEQGCTVIARQQTAGRGRLGRNWVSSPDSGLYISTLLKPEKALAELPVITLCLGVAARRAVQAVSGAELGLKWVNDLIFNTKKVGGILVEMPVSAHTKNNAKALIIGIGINITAPDQELPDEIKEKAVYLNQINDTKFSALELAAELCFQIEEIYKKILENQTNFVLDEWRASSVTLGQEIATANEEVIGKAVNIDENGALIVKTANGNKLLQAGEISIRSADGSYSF